jgi:hypothetical protein
MNNGEQFTANINSDSNHQLVVQKTLSDINKMLAPTGLFITAITKMDRRWQHDRKNRYMLNWKSIFCFMERSNAIYQPLALVFRWREFPLERAGFCLCGYHQENHTLELIALESFVRKNQEHPLTGNMLDTCLEVLYHYGENLVLYGISPDINMSVKISQALNDKLIQFYTSHASFKIIPG